MERTDVLVAVRDLFFRVKLETALTGLGLSVARLEGESPAAAARHAPRLMILDLADAGLDPLESLRLIRADTRTAALPVLGFAPHADRELRARAAEAGCTAVVPRSRIAAGLPELVARWLPAARKV
ncbi:MAG: hypothetical protein ABR599_13035 [Gemmatimonadota bacterium]